MNEWLNSKLFKGWFWREIRSNLWNFGYLNWLSGAPVIVKAVSAITAGLFVCLFFVGYASDPNPLIRGIGVALRIFGFILAAYGLERTLEKFGQVPSTSRILPWWKELLSIFQTSRNAEIVLHGKPARVSVEAGTGKAEYSDLSLSERVERLEERIEELGENIQSRIDEEVERLENKIEKKVEAVEQDVEEVREKVKEVNVGEGALWLEWCGVSLFVYGVPLASFPSFFLPAYRVLAVPVLAGGLLGLLHWVAD